MLACLVWKMTYWLLAVLGLQQSKWCCANIKYLSADVGWCWGLCISCCICVKIWTETGSAAWACAGLNGGSFFQLILLIPMLMCIWLIYVLILNASSCSNKGLRLSMLVWLLSRCRFLILFDIIFQSVICSCFKLIFSWTELIFVRKTSFCLIRWKLVFLTKN